MATRLLQKFLIVFFVGTFIIVLIIGASRIKKQINIVAVDNTGGINPGTTSAGTASNNNPSSVSSGISSSPATPSKTINTSSTKQTFTGTTYRVPWGDVTAQIQVQNGKIIGVSMPNVPDSSPSLYAQPILIEQALAAGSSNIQGVSGATYTSLAFQKSLENAIVRASSALKSSSSSNNSSNSSAASANPSSNSLSGSASASILPPARNNHGYYGDD